MSAGYRIVLAFALSFLLVGRATMEAPTLAAMPRPSQAENSWIGALSFADSRRGWMSQGDRLFATEDGGGTWAHVAVLPGVVRSLDFISPTRGWATTDAWLLATDDAGATWSRVNGVLPEQNSIAAAQVDFVDDRHGWVALRLLQGPRELALRRTQDGGATWEVTVNPCLSSTVPPGPLSFISPTTGWALCVGQPGTQGYQQSKQLYTTQTGADDWELVAQVLFPQTEQGTLPLLPPAMASGLSFVDEEHGYLTTRLGELYETADGGRSWTLRWAEPMSFLTDVHFVSPSVGTMLKWGPGAWVPLLTTDGGASWQELDWPMTSLRTPPVC
jgi:photosystem II stability/assembly factor-like uncharacterized protein